MSTEIKQKRLDNAFDDDYDFYIAMKNSGWKDFRKIFESYLKCNDSQKNLMMKYEEGGTQFHLNRNGILHLLHLIIKHPALILRERAFKDFYTVPADVVIQEKFSPKEENLIKIFIQEFFLHSKAAKNHRYENINEIKIQFLIQ